jgi:hypothetical protein
MSRMMNKDTASCDYAGPGAYSRLRRIKRFIALLAIPLFLGGCTALKNSMKEKIKQNKIVERSKMRPFGQIVLRGMPWHLMVVPRKEYVWLWDKPVGIRKRAMRIKKVLPGTIGRVLEYEPELPSHAVWGEEGYKNYMRQPIRWVRVATFHGTGWVRTEFIDRR